MEEIKRNPLPGMECGMAYLAHPYAPYAPVAKSPDTGGIAAAAWRNMAMRRQGESGSMSM